MLSMNISAWLNIVGRQALCSRETLEATYLLAKDVIKREVPGDLVECGVFAGANAAVMARAVMEGFPVRKVHLFDSFTGIPQAGPHDTEFLAAGHKAGLSAYSLENLKANMAGWGIDPQVLAYHPGLFEDTITPHSSDWKAASIPIALLRLDADLYESTKVCMEYLYPLVSPGGWIIADDFALSGCRKAIDEYLLRKDGPGYAPMYWQR